MPLLFRTLLPLLLLVSGEKRPIVGRTRFQKLIFLAMNKYSEHWYSFIPYNYGPYSKELQQDIDVLIEKGLINEEQESLEDDRIIYSYSATIDGLLFFNKLQTDVELHERIYNIISELAETKKKYQSLPLDELIHLVYNMYPEFTGKSIYQY